MKTNLENVEIIELSDNEKMETSGGFLIALAAAATIYGAVLMGAYYVGYAVGKSQCEQ